MLIMRDSVLVWGQRVYGKSPYLPVNFAKTALKNKILILKIKNMSPDLED